MIVLCLPVELNIYREGHLRGCATPTESKKNHALRLFYKYLIPLGL